MANVVQSLVRQALDYYGFRAEPKPVPGTTPSGVTLSHPIFKQWAQFVGPLGMPPKKSLQALLESYRSWVYSCVRAISFRVASLPLDLVLVEQGSEPGQLDRTELHSHPFLDMLWRPNPMTTRIELWLITMNHLELTGNAYWLLLKDKLGVFRELWPLYPQYMRVIPDETLGVKGYVYLVSNPPIKFEMETADYKVIHFKYPNPLNPYYGVGPLEAQAQAYDLDMYMELYQRNFFEQGARPDFVLETDQQLTKDDAELVWELWDERHKGYAKSWRPGILGFGMKAKPLNVSNRDLAFAVLAGLSRDKVLAAYGVPAAKLGLTTDFNRANADAADLTFNREAILPRCLLIEERTEMDVLANYPGQTDEIWLEAEFENPVPEDTELKLKVRETNLRNFVTVVNEEREEDGMEPVSWGDAPIAPFGTGPMALAPPEGETPPETPPPAPAPEPAPPEPSPPEPAPTEEMAQRTALWEAYVEKTLKEETRFREWMVPLWGVLEDEVVTNIHANSTKVMAYYTGWSERKVRAHVERTPNQVDPFLFALNEATQLFLPGFGEQITQVVDRAGYQAIAEIGVGVWDLQNPLVLEWLKKRAGTQVKDILDTTLKQLRKTLSEGVAKGEGTSELEKRARAVMGIAKGPRTFAIARTEVHTASNYGLNTGWKQSGVVEGKEWLTAHDERVRESHKVMDGVVVPLHEDFHMKPPGSGSGPSPGQIGVAAEDIQCRCTMIAKLMKAVPAPTETATEALTRAANHLATVAERLGAVMAPITKGGN